MQNLNDKLGEYFMYDYGKAITILITRFPSLGIIYNIEEDFYEGLPYVFYEQVFTTNIINKAKEYNESKLSDIFDFVEDMLENGDDDTKNLIEVAVIESLFLDPQYTWDDESLTKFYGKLTKASFQNCV